MTAIAIWCDTESVEHPGLWVAADSRVRSSEGPVLLDDASKIFSLQVVCRSLDANGFFSQVTHSHSYGFCFAGSTLMGQNAYLSLAPLLSNLVTIGSAFPSILDISGYVLKHLDLTFVQYRERVGTNCMFEVAVFGWCPKTTQLSAFYFFPQKDGDVYRMKCESRENMKAHEFIYLGDRKAYFSATIAEAFRGKDIPGRPLSRIPRYVIQDHIEDDAFPTIGGNIQIGFATRLGFQPFMISRPRVLGQPQAYRSYLGRELTLDLSIVGPTIVGGPAIP